MCVSCKGKIYLADTHKSIYSHMTDERVSSFGILCESVIYGTCYENFKNFVYEKWNERFFYMYVDGATVMMWCN